MKTCPLPSVLHLAMPDVPDVKVEWSRHEEMFVATFEEYPMLRTTANTKEAAIQKMERLIDEEDKRVYGEIKFPGQHRSES